MELFEFSSLNRLGEEICNHVVSCTILNCCFIVLEDVSDEEMLDIQMSGTLAGACKSVLFEFDGSLVVLKDHIGFHAEMLVFKKKLGPNHSTDNIINSNNLGFS